MKARLPRTMSMPDEFEALFDWIQTNGFVKASERFSGDLLGMLGPPEGPHQGTTILFRVETPEQARQSGEAWFGDNASDIADRLVPFARTGGDGSYAAFWIDDNGRQQIVHLGSEGTAGILTSTPLDFLRLLGIGYEEIAGDCLEGPNEPPADDGSRLIVNEAYRSWLLQRYATTIPRSASEVIGAIHAGIRRESPTSDPFWNWVYRWQFEGRD